MPTITVMPTISPLTVVTINGEIVGITDVKRDHCCIKCNKPLQLKKVARCENPRCKLTQKLENAKNNGMSNP